MVPVIKINGLYFKDDSKIRVGLFGLNGGTIKNVNIADSYFCGRNAVGGVCGQNYSGNIETCNNINSFVSGNGTVGGVCGNNYSGTIADCNNTGEVQGSINVGGVCGFNYQGSVKNCSNSGNVIGTGASKQGGVGGVCGESDGSLETSYNTGDVKGVYYVGGVCGYQSGGSVDSCYNTGNVTGTSTGASVGGVCGVQSTNGLTSNCYSTGSVICTASDTTNTYVGGVCGFQRGAIKNCYYDNGKFTGKAIDYSASDTSQFVYVEGKTFQLFSNGGVAYLLNSRAAEGSPVWYQNIDNGLDNDAVPVLDSSHGIVYASKPCPVIGSNNENTVSTESKAHSFDNSNICSVCGKKGDVIDDPAIRDHKPTQEGEVYQITSKEELYYFVALVNGRLPDGTQDASASAVLKNDIVVNENLHEKLNEDGTVKDDNTVDSWVAIGYDGIKTYEYTGTFDGGGHKISGLYLDSENYNIGLFGVSSGTIKNVTVEECYFKGKDKVGAVCGYNKGLIENCNAVNGSVCALIFEGTVGGICGSNDSSITNCSTQVMVGCSFNCTRLGGICGSNNATGTISKCYSLGSVKNTYEQVYYGGVCGINSGKISDCYNETAIKNVGKGATFGGICGKNDGEIITSYNTGEISYKDDNGSLSVAKYGGICGWSNKTISDCYNSGYVEVNASSWRHGGGICGYNYGQIKNCYNGSNSGRISGYGGGTYINCYYLSNSSDTSGKTSAQFASGEVAYLLNEGKTDSDVVWRQTLTGEIDTTPVLDSTHSIVYASKPCESEFANTEFEGEKQHNYQISTNGAYHQCSYCKKTEQHADVATFTVNNANHSITATCPSCGNLGTITLSASDATYDGADKAASISGEIKGFDTPSIVYEKKGTDGSFETIDSTPNYAGTYRASITYTVGEEPENKYSVSVEYTIAKAEYEKIDSFDMRLEYDNDANRYTATIEPVDGAEYKFGESGEWSPENTLTGIVHGTEVTGYIRIAGDDNHNPGLESFMTLTSGHGTMKHYEAKVADCVNDGNLEYWYCESCDKYFSDADETIEKTKDDVTIKAKGHTDNDEDGICEVCNAYIDGIGAKLAGYSLSLSGNIGVNFYMELSDEVVADETALMEFTLPNGEKPQVMVSDAEKVTLDNKEYYVFTCEVAAKEMDDIITAQIITADSKGVVYKYTVRDYADYILDEANGYDDNTKAVVSAMLSYGDYAKAYFSGEELTATSEINAVTSDMLAGYAMTESGILPEGIEYYGSTLLLESETTIRHYFKVTEGTDISAYNMTEKGGYYYIQCSDIPAGSLGTAQDISVGEYTISYSPMSYAYAALNSDSTSDNLKNLVKALYIYYQNAYAYNNSNANAA